MFAVGRYPEGDGPAGGEAPGAITFFLRMRNFKAIGKELRELLGQRVLVLDGAMGTMLQQRDLTAADFGGAALEGCNEVLVERGRMWCWIFTANILPLVRTLWRRTVLAGRRWCWRSTV